MSRATLSYFHEGTTKNQFINNVTVTMNDKDRSRSTFIKKVWLSTFSRTAQKRIAF
jgi:hypothetical protein